MFEEILAKKSLNLVKELDLQVQETQLTPKSKNSMPVYNIIAFVKTIGKEKVFKAASGNDPLFTGEQSSTWLEMYHQKPCRPRKSRTFFKY